jgi:integrase
MARGSIQRRTNKDGSVSYLARVEFPSNGKRQQRAKAFPSKRAAESHLAKWLTEIESGAVVLPDTSTVGDLLDTWLVTVAAHKLRPSSLAGYRYTIDRYIKPNIGAVRAQRLTPIQVEAFYAGLRAEGKGARTVQLCHLRLNQALAWAARLGHLARNVCDFVDAPTHGRTAPTIWTPEQARTFLGYAGPWQPLFALMLDTGLRRGEVLSLQWSDLDADARLLHVRRGVTYVKGRGFLILEPKTSSGRRKIRLSAETITMLKQHRAAQNEDRLRLGPIWQGQDLIFPNERGGIIFPRNLGRAFAAIQRKAGVPPIRLHDLRHTHGSWLLLSGQPIQTVSERLGHAKPSITLDLYAHTLQDSQDAAAEIVGMLLSRARKSALG